MKVLLTGAAGGIGTMLRERLPSHGVQLRLFDQEPLDGGVTGDVADPAALDQAFDQPVDAVVHLAGQATEAPWPRIRDANVEGTYQLFEAARRHGVRRVVYASSNHAVGFTPRAVEDLRADTPHRPDTLYGLSKAFGEALARYYVDRYGMQVACLRIGTCTTTPPDYRSLATWLSPDDCARLVHAALIAPDLTYALVWGISANTRRWWSLDAGRAIGFEPLDDAETYVRQLPAERNEPLPSDDLVGGGYTTAEPPRFWPPGQLSDAGRPKAGADLRARVDAWIADDVDEADAAELRALLDGGDVDELTDRFRAPLAFGTAGLRGPLRAGPNGMNRAVVRRTAAGIAAWLGARHPGSTVVIGYDGRHGSYDFAHDSAAVFAAAGFDARVLPRLLPTPVLAFAVRHLGAAVGVMVTASHNPPRDNGYKVYAGDGAQIVAPTDAEIEAAIEAAGPAREVALSREYLTLDEPIVEAYVAAVSGLVDAGPRDVRIVHTAMHGVGTEVLARVFAAAGFAPLIEVPQQAAPDPEFPTVSFPNPEEPGALDLALALARDQDADIAIANDPDADRCAVAVPDGGVWRMLRGDEVGVLLADALLRKGIRGTYATTIVSSTMLRALAARHEVGYAETLTGFKWISRAAVDLVYGYEEALGYAVAPSLVRDKDGISAALLVAELAATSKASGSSLPARLDELAAEYGRYATDQISVRVDDLSIIADSMARLRAAPPTTLLGEKVTVTDRRPDADVLTLTWPGGRVVVRPSGTEPKLKAYLEVVVADGSRDEAARRLAQLRDEVGAVLTTPGAALSS